jgi:hypothetical protein
VVGCVVTVKDEVPLLPAVRVTLVGLTETAGPLGETDGDNVIVPTKPPRLVSVIVEEPEAPCARESDEGLDEIPKSGEAGCVTETLLDTVVVALAESWTISCALKVPDEE